MPQPELVLHRPKPGCRLSIILLDWGVRESFHSLHYLNQQTVARDQYEIIWLEFYQHKPAKLKEMVFRNGPEAPLVDQWLCAGYDADTLFNKHRLYNLGLLMSGGEYCVICDSDAIFTPNFVAGLLAGFVPKPRSVLHLDEVRNNNPRFHPFAYPTIDEVLGDGCINWTGEATIGLADGSDMIHQANYGACMAAPRTDLLAIGGADEHADYLGYICGPYDMTFRLVNYGFEERWLRDEYLYHVWHPNMGGANADYQGPSDGLGMSLRALECRATGRIEPWLENPWIRRARRGAPIDMHELMQALAARNESTWRIGRQPRPEERAALLERDYHGFNLYLYRGRWYGLPIVDGLFEPKLGRRYRVLLQGKEAANVKHLVDYYNRLPTTWWRRLACQPWYRLPWRAARRIGKEIARRI